MPRRPEPCFVAPGSSLAGCLPPFPLSPPACCPPYCPPPPAGYQCSNCPVTTQTVNVKGLSSPLGAGGTVMVCSQVPYVLGQCPPPAGSTGSTVPCEAQLPPPPIQACCTSSVLAGMTGLVLCAVQSGPQIANFIDPAAASIEISAATPSVLKVCLLLTADASGKLFSGVIDPTSFFSVTFQIWHACNCT